MTGPDLSPAELTYLTEEPRLARVATADGNGRPQVTPVGMWKYRPDLGVVDFTGHDFASTRKYRNVQTNPQAALVVDDLAPGEGWNPRGIMLEGPAEALEDDGAGGGPLIRLIPDRVVSWGL